MDTVKTIFNTVVMWLQIPFELYGYTLSLWDLLIYGLLASFLIWIIVKIFDFGSNL